MCPALPLRRPGPPLWPPLTVGAIVGVVLVLLVGRQSAASDIGDFAPMLSEGFGLIVQLVGDGLKASRCCRGCRADSGVDEPIPHRLSDLAELL
jgi:hypothetical protein